MGEMFRYLIRSLMKRKKIMLNKFTGFIIIIFLNKKKVEIKNQTLVVNVFFDIIFLLFN